MMNIALRHSDMNVASKEFCVARVVCMLIGQTSRLH